MPDAVEPELSDPPTLIRIFLAFSKIGLTSFGGGLSGWMLRELVQRRRWISEESFMNGLAIAQAFPGVNVVNLAIWIGYQLRGGRGALLAASGIVVPPMISAIGLLVVFEHLSSNPSLKSALAGVAAAAVGLSFNMGFRALYRAARKLVPALLALVTFCSIAVFQLPLFLVVAVMAPLSIALAYRRLRSGVQA